MKTERKHGYLNIDSSMYETKLSHKFENRRNYIPVDPKKILSYIPGIVIEIFVSPGMLVKQGQELMIIDAMKMKNRIRCNIDGKVKSVCVLPGSRVGKGNLLVELE